jgi:hypothetical protein
MDTCPDCQVWLMCSGLNPALDAGSEDKIIRALMADLEPVPAIRSKQRSAVFLLLGSLFVVLGGIVALGVRGWMASGVAMRSCLTSILTVGLAMGAFLIPPLFIPGELLRVRPSVAIAATLIAVIVPTFFRTTEAYPGFLRAALTCVAIGLFHACVVVGIVYGLLRHGLVVSRVWTYMFIGSFAGLTGFAVLFIFCPHVDLAHHLLAHAGMLLLSVALGGCLAVFSRER